MNPIIKVENLSKRYRIGLKEKQHDTLFGQIGAALKAPVQNFKKLRSLRKFDQDDESVFWALKDINFEVHEGEVLGIIGHNGAGKSTLLKILSRVTEPTTGRITLHGRVGALLEVGTGFHPELTGRENIYMNGTILGMTKKEIDRKLDEIVDFSGVEKYIDTPVKFYSSGMKVRLGFSVAAHLEPELLLIDEVLAVGDAQFQKKCLGKMDDISQTKGRTLLFVSHNMAAIQSICHRVLVLKNGKIVWNGDIVGGIDAYSSHLRVKEEITTGDNTVQIVNHSINSSGVTEIEFDKNFKIEFEIYNFRANSCSLYIIIENGSGNNVIHERIDGISISEERNFYRINFPVLWLRPGLYNYYLKIISTDISSINERYVSERYVLRVNGEVDAPKLLGTMTPTVTIEND